jgi:branched-chain amino acid transport system substrate-binding protein
VGFLGYTDAYGESWLKDFTAEADKNGIKVIATERFARSDTSVTAQALKLVAANPDAMLIVASGSGAAMPHMAVVDRGFKGKIYQTHAAATRDLMRVGGKDVEGRLRGVRPGGDCRAIARQPPSKKVRLTFVAQYEKAYGPAAQPVCRPRLRRHARAGKIVPMALKKGKPGTPEFRAALRDAFGNHGPHRVAHGVLNWTKDDHWGYTNGNRCDAEGGQRRLEGRVRRWSWPSLLRAEDGASRQNGPTFTHTC